MNFPARFLFLSLCAALSVAGTAAAQPIAAARLRCESLTNPMGIEVQRPQLSWVLESDRRGVSQSAYRVLVATTEKALKADKGDLWDSGRVESDNSTTVAYGGKALTADQRCFWKVQVWNQKGELSPWSGIASWSAGLLSPGDWEAQWIGYDAERVVEKPVADFGEAQWILYGDDDPAAPAPGNRMYIARFEIPAGVRVRSAEVLAVADDKHWLAINGKILVHEEPGWEIAKPVDATEALQEGENEVRFNVHSLEERSGLLARLQIVTDSGEEIVVATNKEWLATNSPGMHWPTEPLGDKNLKPCQELGPHGQEPWGLAHLQGLFLPPTPLLRSEFLVTQPIVQATLYASSLGNCDAYLNGGRVSEEWYTPGWTDYRKRVYYRAYDVTEMLRQGENALGGVLADGWYCGYVGWGRNRNHYGTLPRLRLQLNIRYADGSSEVVATGPDWKAGTGGTREADFLMGETHDARLEPQGWKEPGFDDSGWGAVVVGAEIETLMQPHPGQPVATVEEFKPVAITNPQPGAYVFDMGQNFAGVARLKVQGKPGQQIRLRFAERLKPDGSVYTINLRGARTVDTYTCKGGGVEVWEPRFTFHGFQYVEVTGLEEPPTEETITGVAVSSDTPLAGGFESSDPVLNRLHKNILWTQRANFIDVPTDCPQRDERLGWTGDAQVYVATACMNTDSQAFFRKWLVDLDDSQRADGQFPMVAPLIVAGDDGGPAWADAGVICPWTVYHVYGDTRLLATHYPAMKKFVEFCRGRSVGGVLPPEEFHCFGDWLSIEADTPHRVIYTAYYAQCARLLSQAAEVLARSDEAEEYARLYRDIKSAFNKEFVAEDGRVEGDTQCCYVLALISDLVDGEQRERAAAHLADRIAERDYHLSTGFVGTKDLMLVLSKIGRNDIAYRLLHNESFPSWGFSIKQGATSIWERWDGWTPEKGFQDPGMNSFAHYSFGAVYQWIAENVGGIRRVEPGYKHFVIAPQPGGELTWANTDYDSIRGRIASHWRLEGGRMKLTAVVPANSTAEVLLPTADADAVLEGGKVLSEAEGVRGVEARDGATAVRVGSGTYEFELPLDAT